MFRKRRGAGGAHVYYGWTLVWALGVTTVISYGTTQYLFGVLLVPIQRDLGWSRGALSGAFSVSFMVAGMAGVVVGHLVDRRGARALMTAGSLLGAMCLALLSRVDQLWQFYVLWAGGIGLAMALTFYPVTFTVITNWFSRGRASALALLTVIGGFASVVFYPLAGALIAAFGWRTALLVMAGCQLLIAAPVHAVVLRRHPDEIAEQPRPGHRLREALGRPAFWTLTASSGLALMAHASVLAHQVPYLIGRGYAPVFAASVAGLLGVASLPSRLVLNLLSERYGARALLILSTALLAAGVGLLMLASPGRPLVLWLFVGVYGFAFGAVSPLRAAVMGDQFGRRAYGAITASQGVAVALMTAVGPIVAGALYDRFGDYRIAFALVVAAFVAALIALTLTPPPAELSSHAAPAPAGV